MIKTLKLVSKEEAFEVKQKQEEVRKKKREKKKSNAVAKSNGV